MNKYEFGFEILIVFVPEKKVDFLTQQLLWDLVGHWSEVQAEMVIDFSQREKVLGFCMAVNYRWTKKKKRKKNLKGESDFTVVDASRSLALPSFLSSYI